MRVLEREIDVRFWLKMALAVLFTMLMPLWSYSNSFSSLHGDPTEYFSYTCILLNYQNGNDWTEPDIWIRGTPSIVAALIVCIPAIYFNHRLSREPRSKSVWDIGLATLFSTASLAAYFTYVFPPIFWAPLVPGIDSDLLSFTSVVLIFLVLLPILARETSQFGVEKIAASPTKPRNKSGTYARQLKTSTTYSIIGYVLCLAACILPYVVIISIWSMDEYTYYAVSIMASIFHQSSWIPMEGTFSYITFNTRSLMQLVDQFLITGFQVLFCYSLIRYCRGRASRYRTLSYGIAGLLVPLVYIELMRSQYAFADMSYIIPLPIFFILGLVIVQVVKPLEQEIEIETEEVEGIVSVDEEGREHYGDYVEIPLLYSMRSLVGRAMSRLKQSKNLPSSTAFERDQTRNETGEGEVSNPE